MKRLWRSIDGWLLRYFGDSPAQWEHERAERHRVGNDLVRKWRVRSLKP